jgi:hypothetical protein
LTSHISTKNGDVPLLGAKRVASETYLIKAFHHLFAESTNSKKLEEQSHEFLIDYEANVDPSHVSTQGLQAHIHQGGR